LLPSGIGSGSSQTELLAIPQISSAGNAGVVSGRTDTAFESGKHVEVSWERKLGTRYRIQAAGFFDSLTNVAVSLSGAANALFPIGLLKDPFSDTQFLNAGNYSSPGARASMGARISPNSELVVGYSYAGGLQAVSDNLTTENSPDMRDMLRAQREHSFVVKLRSTLPRTRTQVITSYKWLPRNAILPTDPYDDGRGRSEPYLNIAVVQPIPSPDILPGQFQAIADFNNLLAQGYLPIHGADGNRSYFFPSARSFRGGFNFVF
jgi:hypothetical protein